MAFEINTTREFSASHQLRLYDGSLEPLHGHNWRVRVTVSAQKLDAMSVVMDFHELERLIDQLLSPLHNHHLNDVPPFTDASMNPSAENVALHIARSLGAKLPKNVQLSRVEVWETDSNSAAWTPDNPAFD
jgi:6-pyruvoyltetrahydropterin/6-carboxytetrahydropterin synthase